MGFTREAESPCPRVEGPTPQLATKRSLVPGVLFFSLVPGARCGRADPAVGNEALAGTRRSVFFAGTRRSLVPQTKTKTIFFHTKTKISRTHTRTDFFVGMYQLETRFARITPITQQLIYVALPEDRFAVVIAAIVLLCSSSSF